MQSNLAFEFQNLTVYQKAKAFHASIVDDILNQEGLTRDQLGHASFSVILNIAEGSSRFTKPSRKNFMVNASGAVFECAAAMEILCDQDLMHKNLHSALLAQTDELPGSLMKSVVADLKQG